MEYTDSSIHHDHYAISSSESNHVQPTMNSSANKGNPSSSNSNDNDPVPQLAMPDRDTIGIATVTKVMRKGLPSNAKISNDVKMVISKCASRFISVITQKAKERSQSECRRTLQAEDLLWAMENLGFGNYVELLTIFLQLYHKVEGDLITYSKGVIDLQKTKGLDGLSWGQSLNNDGLGYGLVPEVGTLQPALAQPDSSFGLDFSMDPSTILEMFDPAGIDVSDGDGSGVGWSNNDIANFDPSTYFNMITIQVRKMIVGPIFRAIIAMDLRSNKPNVGNYRTYGIIFS